MRGRRASGPASKLPRMRGARAVASLIVIGLFAFSLVCFPLRRHAAAKGNEKTAKPSASAVAERDDTVPGAKGGPRGDAGAALPAEAKSANPDQGGKAEKADKAEKGSKTEKDEPTLPVESGLPVVVNVAVYFLELKSFDDNKGEFSCTTDIRYRWMDLRLAYPAAEAYRGYKEWRGKEAEDKLASIWTPNIEVVNRVEATSYVGRRVRIFPNGRVELIARQTASYKVEVHSERFPFDRQDLVVDLLVREQTTDAVVLTFENDDVTFSRVSRRATLEGWDPGLVNLDDDVVPGWNGDRYSRVRASLFVDRLASMGFAPIFIPLVASLLIPLLAIWMNRATQDGFEIEAFELANIGIGGLFSVIALSFAIYSSYTAIAASDNTVTRLFGLNYATLATALAIVVALFQFNLPHRWFGGYVHRQVFKWITWALPVVTASTSAAFLLVAAA